MSFSLCIYIERQSEDLVLFSQAIGDKCFCYISAESFEKFHIHQCWEVKIEIGMW